MDAFVVSNQPTVSAAIAAGLERLGVRPKAQLRLDEAQHRSLELRDRGALPVLFVGFQDPSPEELAALAQLGTLNKDRARIVAIGSLSKPNVILHAIRSGAIDYLDLNGDLTSDLKFIVQRLQAAPSQQETLGKLFTVVSPVGGTGASFLAANLAAALARREGPCGLLDLKLRGGDLATLLKATPRYTLMSLAEKLEQLDSAMFSQSLIKLDCGVHLLASPEPFADFRKINIQVIQKVLHLARTCCAQVVVDLEDAEHTEQVRTLAESTQILIPLRLDFVALTRTKKCIDHLRKCKINPQQITLVASRTGQPNELAAKAVEEVLGLKVEHSVPFDAALVNGSINLGVPLVIARPDSKVAKSILRLSEYLVGGAAAAVAPAHSGLMQLPAKVCSFVAGILSAEVQVTT